MNPTEGDEHGFRTICREPAVEEERENKTMEDV
jgi:hypothetical protein